MRKTQLLFVLAVAMVVGLVLPAQGDLAAPASLPVEYAGANSWSNNSLSAMTGWRATGLSSPYAAPNASAKFDDAGDSIIIYFDGAAGEIVYSARRSDGSALAGPYEAKLQEGVSTSSWTDVRSFDGTELNGTLKTFTNSLLSSSRYVRFIYVTKPAGQNFGVGYVKITAGGPAEFSVSVDKTDGFEVEEGTSDAITATAANGTPPYTYEWSDSTLGASYYTTNANVYTILATAPTGSYSVKVTATDNAAQTTNKTVNFSVVAPPTKYAITITAPVNGTVTTTPATEAAAGVTVTINATPDGGYAVDTITVVGADTTPITVTGNTFTMPAQAVTVTVTFKVFTGSALIISEVADPSDNLNARFVELYNAGGSAIDLAAGQWYLARQANGVTWARVALTGTVSAAQTYVLVYSVTNFTAAYPGAVYNQSAGSVVTGNGDDGYFLYSGGDESSGTLEDAYGVIGQDGSGMPWEYEDARATRNAGVTAGNPTWTASEWTITDPAAAAAMTPGVHPDGAAVFSVTVDKADGFEVEEGTSDAITATAANGTPPYTYEWSDSTLGASYYTTNANVYTILATAPTGSYSVKVTATDNAAQTTNKTVNFSVLAPPTKYAITITPPANGTVTTTPATEAAAGVTVTINATPAGGYAVDTITVVGADTTPITVTGNTFTMPAQAVTVTVTFKVFTGSALIISEVADPTDNASGGRFVELYNSGGTSIDLAAGNWHLARQVNGGTTWGNIALTGTVSAGATYIIAGSTNYPTVYPLAPAANQTSGNIDGNGDDGYFLFSGGRHTNGILEDAYGVKDQDGTGQPWEYMDARAVRNAGITAGNPTWTASEWTITAAAVANMTPGVHPDGGAAPSVKFTAALDSAGEAAVTYVVTAVKTLPSGDVSGQVGLSGTAAYGGLADYTVDTTNFTMNGATTSATFTVTINDDAEVESPETVILTLANVVGGNVAVPSVFTLTINDNDGGGVAQPGIERFTTIGGVVRVTVPDSQNGVAYKLEWTPAMKRPPETPAWSNATEVTGNGGTIILSDPTPPSGSRVYRIAVY